MGGQFILTPKVPLREELGMLRDIGINIQHISTFIFRKHQLPDSNKLIIFKLNLKPNYVNCTF